MLRGKSGTRGEWELRLTTLARPQPAQDVVRGPEVHRHGCGAPAKVGLTKLRARQHGPGCLSIQAMLRQKQQQSGTRLPGDASTTGSRERQEVLSEVSYTYELRFSLAEDSAHGWLHPSHRSQFKHHLLRDRPAQSPGPRPLPGSLISFTTGIST